MLPISQTSPLPPLSCPSWQDQLSAVLGTSGAPSPTAVVVTIASLLFVNSLLYVSLMHVLYSILLRGMGLRVDRMPGFVSRMLPAASGAGIA